MFELHYSVDWSKLNDDDDDSITCSYITWTRLCDCACCRRRGRSLGHSYYRGTGPILLDDLHCRGSETQLGDCRHRPWGSHNCDHSEDVSIACDDYGTGWL